MPATLTSDIPGCPIRPFAERQAQGQALGRPHVQYFRVVWTTLHDNRGHWRIGITHRAGVDPAYLPRPCPPSLGWIYEGNGPPDMQAPCAERLLQEAVAQYELMLHWGAVGDAP